MRLKNLLSLRLYQVVRPESYANLLHPGASLRGVQRRIEETLSKDARREVDNVLAIEHRLSFMTDDATDRQQVDCGVSELDSVPIQS